MIRKSLLMLVFVVGAGSIHAGNRIYNGAESNYNVIQTPVPFLNIAPDSRSGSMGDIGAATTPDLYSMHWNAAKYAFLKDNIGLSVTYSPWLKSLANDISLAYLTGFYRLDKRQTVAASLRYFSLGQIAFTNEMGESVGGYNPHELAVDAAYSRLFSDNLSGGLAFRYIYSALSIGQFAAGSSPTQPGKSFAADVSVYYRVPVTLDDKSGEWAWGLNISNIGTKISYTEDAVKDFIPTNLRLGTALNLNIDAYNKFSIAVDVNKLLVPSPPIWATDSNGIKYDAQNKPIFTAGLDPDVSVTKGIFQSFYDAPGGYKEELKELMFSVGAEYWYYDQFAFRGGYFHESEMKGNRKYFTLGLGFKMALMFVDFSYLIPTQGRNNPLANTLRLSGGFIFGQTKKQK